MNIVLIAVPQYLQYVYIALNMLQKQKKVKYGHIK